MPLVDTRSTADTVYIPVAARENQYLLSQIQLPDFLITQLANHYHVEESDLGTLYSKMSEDLFAIADKATIANILFIANDKLPRVRFNQELHQWQTNQQILFFYNPQIHRVYKTFYDPTYKADKVSLLFLAAGEDIRANAGYFHQKVYKVITTLCRQLNLPSHLVRVRDHQHLTYDLFAKEKGVIDAQMHQFRDIAERYKNQTGQIPPNENKMTYAVATLPITPTIENQIALDLTSEQPYSPLYARIADDFCAAARRFNLNNGAMIANGLIPIVRRSEQEEVICQGELQMLGYRHDNNNAGIICKWNGTEQVDAVQLIFVASDLCQTHNGYGLFINQIEKALKLFATKQSLIPHRDELTIRVHQHMAYSLNSPWQKIAS